MAVFTILELAFLKDTVAFLEVEEAVTLLFFPQPRFEEELCFDCGPLLAQ